MSRTTPASQWPTPTAANHPTATAATATSTSTTTTTGRPKRQLAGEQLGLGPASGGEPYFEPLTGGPGEEQPASQQRARGKRTLYACEEKQLQIECQLGESIQLIRANYGRFSIQICNEHGQLDWKVNCMSPMSFQIISNR